MFRRTVPSSLLTAGLRLGDLWGNLARGVATVTGAPAQAAGLEDRGHLRPGARADVIRVARLGQAAVVRGTWVAGNRVA
jgi:alpha-D-ribose 1-methylphosphonate 5-triphosphate diphosphatase